MIKSRVKRYTRAPRKGESSESAGKLKQRSETKVIKCKGGTMREVKGGILEQHKGVQQQNWSAPPGNRTRVARMGILHDTTTPAARPGTFLPRRSSDLPQTLRRPRPGAAAPPPCTGTPYKRQTERTPQENGGEGGPHPPFQR